MLVQDVSEMQSGSWLYVYSAKNMMYSVQLGTNEISDLDIFKVDEKMHYTVALASGHQVKILNLPKKHDYIGGQISVIPTSIIDLEPGIKLNLLRW